MSNIAVVYGYSFDPSLASNSVDFDPDSLDLPDGFKVYTPYSITSYDPNCFVIGIPVQKDICMFSPTKLQNNITPEQMDAVGSFVIPNELQGLMSNSEPEFLVFGYSDD